MSLTAGTQHQSKNITGVGRSIQRQKFQNEYVMPLNTPLQRQPCRFLSSSDRSVKVSLNLTAVLKNTPPPTPLTNIGKAQFEAMYQLENIFRQEKLPRGTIEQPNMRVY